MSRQPKVWESMLKVVSLSILMRKSHTFYEAAARSILKIASVFILIREHIHSMTPQPGI